MAVEKFISKSFKEVEKELWVQHLNNAGLFLKEAIKDYNSFKLGEKNIAEIDEIDFIVMVGSSATGKSTMVDAVRNLAKESPNLQIPLRAITRPRRENDNMIENVHLTLEVFFEYVEDEKIRIHWQRKMEEDRKEFYGFLPEDDAGSLWLLSGNNALYDNKKCIVPSTMLHPKKTLWVGTYAPNDIRSTRLQVRSPDISGTKEGNVRLQDNAENVIPHAHIVINNFDSQEKTSVADFQNLLEIILRHRMEEAFRNAQKQLFHGQMEQLWNQGDETRKMIFLMQELNQAAMNAVMENLPNKTT